VIDLVASGGRKSPEAVPNEIAACIARVKARTHQFARRQETWFRSLSECTPVPMQKPIEPATVAESIATIGSHHGPRSGVIR
jgi:tRNA dimethylallyltransferase